jgi:hypothetical protein
VAKVDIPVPIEDASTTLGILDSQMMEWVREDKPNITENHRGAISVPQSYVTACSSKLDYYSALLNSIRVENEHKYLVLTSEKKIQLHTSRQSMLKVYSEWIERLEKIHKEYKNIFNEFDNESWEFAAYLLLSRAIALLKGIVVLFTQGYWYAGSIIREIDETLDVAQYFKISAHNDEHTDLRNWFRLNKAPGHSKCRKVIAAHHASIVPNTDTKKHEYLLNELYQKKSKWTHPNFGVIRESGSFDVINHKLQINELCYGECEHEFKIIELVDHFKSSIWTTYQQFMILFVDILSVEHKNEIIEFDSLQKKI